MTSLGLVVVGYQSDNVWPGFFESLAHSSVVPDQIVVVENSPSLPTSIPTLPGLWITVLHRPDNPGYGASANHGVAELAKIPDLIVICNPDIVWQSHTLETLIKEMESRPTVGIDEGSDGEFSTTTIWSGTTEECARDSKNPGHTLSDW